MFAIHQLSLIATMGLCQAEIFFKEKTPTFQTISQQYKQQTGLDIALTATIHLATGEFGEVLKDSATLVSILQSDAAAVAAIENRYNVEERCVLLASQYEQAAALRDRMKEEKARLNHISRVEIAVGYGDFYPIEVSVHDQVLVVNRYHNQHYAVVSLIKSLVDLGGLYRWGDKEQPLPKSWRKLKQWQNYKWYNRPRK
ncbi:hypothetical protein IC235_01825 [Hymenobacter sp. BT664]|uniref:Uncharacterized protein n=1 Tax=Hymenobacter montanus TaxID=2771359 RepID=A0A927GI05_9BACT|nr:hypothetical protein [Hymenobacter montanus]MBD2766629.1 hypothetical protein [Hymenobacter montanus]